MRKIFIDCPQEIPCNPCMSLCRTGAVTVKDLTGRPETEPALCVGCDNCVAGCPGQACFLIDEEEEQEIKTPVSQGRQSVKTQISEPVRPAQQDVQIDDLESRLEKAMQEIQE